MILAAGLAAGCAGEEEQAQEAGGSAPVSVYIRNTEGIDAAAINDQPVMEEIRKKSGVDFRIEAGAEEGDDYETKLNLTFSSGDYPGVFASELGLFETGVPRILDSGVLVPLDEYLDRYGKNLKEKIPQEAWDQVTYDGQILGIPEVNPYGEHEKIMYVNQDWLDALNLQKPTNMDEFYEMLVAFRDDDPNGNGQQDEIPLSAREGFEWMPTLEFYGVPEGAWAEGDGGQLVPGWSTEAWKEATAFEQELYEEGLLYREAVTGDTVKDKRDAGLVGVYTHQSQVAAADPKGWGDGNWDVIPWFCADGVAQCGELKYPVARTYQVTDNAADPAEVVKLFDWIVSDEGQETLLYGAEGRSHTKEGGEISYDITRDPDTEFTGEMGEAGGPKWRYYWLRLVNDGLLTEEELVTLYGEEDGAFAARAIEEANKAGVDNHTDGVPPAQILERQPDLANPDEELRVKIITGEEDPEAVDRLFEDWKGRGGDEVMQYVNDNHS